MHSFYLDAIRNFEGFTPQAKWDYAQFSNGFGTRAKFAGEVIDAAEAERRFRSEVSAARSIVEKAAPGIDEGTKAALTSLTYNAGSTWVQSGLGDAVRSGDLDAVRDIFQKYNKAGGEVLPGLVSRRSQEAMWIGNPEAAAAAAAAMSGEAVAAEGPALPPVVLEDQGVRSLAQILERAQQRASGQSQQVNAGRMTSEAARGPRVETALARGVMSDAANDALAALVGSDLKGMGAIADVARLAQLGRGSELAGAGKDRRDDEATRRA